MPGFGSGFFSSLQFRLALGFFVALAVALVLIGVATGVAAGRQTERFDRDRNSAQVARLRHFVTDYYALRSGWELEDASLQESVQRASSHIVVYDAGGVVIADSHPGLLNADGSRNGKARVGRFNTARKIPIRFGDEEVGAFTVSAPPVGAPPSFGIAEPTADRISTGVKLSLLWAGIGATALGTLLVWLISRRTLAPLQNLGAAARRLGRGDFSQRADDSGPTEIRELALNFNAMAAELEEAERHRRNLAADIAHELRTPLSNIQGYLEAIRDGLSSPPPKP